jgi:hypothetical protein
MRLGFVVIIAAVLALSMAAAWAYPTLGGATGIVTLPTADVTPTGSADLAVDYQQATIDGDALSSLGFGTGMYVLEEGKGAMASFDGSDVDVKSLPARLTVGIAEKAEIWGAYDWLDTDVGTANIWSGGAKVLLMTEPADECSLGIGGSIGRAEMFDETLDLASAFLVLSKNISAAVSPDASVTTKLSVGAMWQSLGDPADIDSIRPFVGIEFITKESGTFALEYRFKDDKIDAQAPFSAVWRYPIPDMPALTVEIGTTNAAIGGLGLTDQRIFGGIGYRITSW